MNITQKHQIVPYKWYTYKYILTNNILTEKDIELSINGFIKQFLMSCLLINIY